MLEWRPHLAHWLKMDGELGGNIDPIDYQAISYYSAPKSKTREGLDEVDPKLLETYEKLGIRCKRAALAGVAVDRCSTASRCNNLQGQLASEGDFLLVSEALKAPELIEKYVGTVVPQQDNFFAALNSAVFTDGSFVTYPGRSLPHGTVHLFSLTSATQASSSVRSSSQTSGYVSTRLHGAAADEQLHAAVVELMAKNADQILNCAELVSRRCQRQSGIYNFVTKRGDCKGETQDFLDAGRNRFRHHMEISKLCVARRQLGWRVLSVALTNNAQQADTGTKMIPRCNTSSIISKDLRRAWANVSVVRMAKSAEMRNYTQCDSLLLGDRCGAHTFPYVEVKIDRSC